MNGIEVFLQSSCVESTGISFEDEFYLGVAKYTIADDLLQILYGKDARYCIEHDDGIE